MINDVKQREYENGSFQIPYRDSNEAHTTHASSLRVYRSLFQDDRFLRVKVDLKLVFHRHRSVASLCLEEMESLESF